MAFRGDHKIWLTRSIRFEKTTIPVALRLLFFFFFFFFTLPPLFSFVSYQISLTNHCLRPIVRICVFGLHLFVFLVSRGIFFSFPKKRLLLTLVALSRIACNQKKKKKKSKQEYHTGKISCLSEYHRSAVHRNCCRALFCFCNLFEFRCEYFRCFYLLDNFTNFPLPR